MKVVIDQIGDNLIVLSTDYPHDDSLFPHAVGSFLGLKQIGESMKRNIL